MDNLHEIMLRHRMEMQGGYFPLGFIAIEKELKEKGIEHIAAMTLWRLDHSKVKGVQKKTLEDMQKVAGDPITFGRLSSMFADMLRAMGGE